MEVVLNKFTIVLCETAVVCFKAPFIPPSPLSLSPSHVQLSCEIKRVQSGEFFPLPSEEEVQRLHKVGLPVVVYTQHQETIVLRVSVQPQGRRKYEYDSKSFCSRL